MATKDLHRLVLTAGQFEVEVDADLVQWWPGEGLERVLQGEPLAGCGRVPVVGHDQRRAFGLGHLRPSVLEPEHVELDHVNADLDRLLEAVDRIAGNQSICSFMSYAGQSHLRELTGGIPMAINGGCDRGSFR